ncbi:hypothetical protein PMIT1323_01117 [Prochlorococcus marinus str. MIT 1323]|nr:hypothetical protein PMIT1323_01117 [Prochlorococcus marinus str. MIT 1323]
MVYSEKVGGVATQFDAQNLFVVWAPERLFSVWCEDMTFVHVGADARCGCAN